MTHPPNDANTSNMVRYTYNYVDASGHNNGNVVSITDGLTANYSQTYSYDSLNRLKTAQTTSTHATDAANCWAETYNYDPWGNLLKLGADTVNQSAYVGCTQESGFDFTNFTGTSNRITASGYGYDSAGNVTTAPGVSSPTFNAENQLVSAGGVTYTYDGDGKRIMKSNGTIYWYGMNSDALIETDLNNNAIYYYFFFNGRRVARRQTNVDWYFADALGTSRTVWTLSGVDRSDYYPFGGERPHSSVTNNHYKFTSKERDSESGLDNFGARFDSSTLGRFMSPDWSATAEPIPYAKLDDPQSLNSYSYVKNNPVNLTDPDGHCWWGFQHICNGIRYHHWVDDSHLNAALENEAKKALAAMSKNGVQVTIHGETMSSDQYLRGKTNKEIIDAFNDYQLRKLEGDVGAVVPPMPPNMSAPQFGRDVMKWGRGHAEARARMQTLTREELEKSGVTKEMAKAWRDFYQNEAARVSGNPSAAERAELMQKAYELLGGE